MWYYPQAGSYKKALRNVYKNYDRAVSKAKTLKEIITTEFTEEKQNQKFVDAVLEALNGYNSMPEQVVTL